MKKDYNLFSWQKAKNVLAGLSFALLGTLSYGQVVNIGTETTVGKGIPIEPYYGYSYSQNIYLSSEIGQSGDIYAISFRGTENINLSNSNEWVVYMANSTKSEFSSTGDWLASSDLTQVYAGVISASSNGEVTLQLTTPFNYNGTDNLVIAVEENKASYNSNADDFYASEVTTNRSIYYRNDSTNPDPASPPTATGVQKFISNVKLDFTPITCPQPSDFTASNISTTTMNLSWTAGGSETAWNIEYGANGFTQGSGTTVAVSANPYTLTGLTPNTSYDVYLQSDCGTTNGQSNWIGPVSVKTQCEAFTTEYCEGFADTPTGYSSNPTIPDCWSFIDGGSGYGYVSGTNPNTDANAFYIYNGNDSSGNYMLVSPNTTNLSDGNHRVKFSMYAYGTYDAIVGTMSDPTDASTFTALETVTLSATSTHEEFIVNVPSGTDNYFAIKHGLGGSYRSLYIDNVCFEQVPSCIKPSGVTSSNVAITTADIAWVAPSVVPANGYEYYYSINSTAPDANTTASGTSTTNTVSLSGLSAGTSYNVWVRSVCSSTDVSAWSASPHVFITECLASEVPNYSNGFESTTCWSIVSGEDQSGTTAYWLADGFLNNGTTGAMKFNSYSVNRIGWFVSPTFNLSGGGNYQLSFNYGLTKYNSTSAGVLGSDDKIILKMSEDNGQTWTDVKVWTSADNITNTSNAYTYTISSTSATVKFAFYANDGTVNDSEDVEFFVDDFAIMDSSLATSEVNVRDIKGVQLYPNPFQDVVYINDIKGVDKITIVDMAGRIVKSFVPSKELNLTGLNSGMYLVNLSYEDGSIKTLKAIKK